MIDHNLIGSIIESLQYNREDEDSYNVICEVINRLLDKSDQEWTDDGNIIYGMLVCAYGDFGTSPRSGWIEDEDVKKELIEFFESEKYDIENHTQWGIEKFGGEGEAR